MRFGSLVHDRPRAASARTMKKTSKPSDSGDDLRPEYDFRGGVRGKYVERFRQAPSIVVLHSAVPAQSKDSQALTNTLRTTHEPRTKSEEVASCLTSA